MITRVILFLVLIAGVARSQLPVEARIDTLITRQMRARHIPGLSLAVVRDGRVVYAKGYGEANIEWHAPATPETVYLLASVTKQFTATAIMMLVGEGKVRLTDTIGTYVTAAPSWKNITIRHLLTHTAGLKDRFEFAPDGRMYMDYSTEQMLEAARKTPVDFAPGASWQYSDQGYFLLGAVVERASGKSYEQFLRERIFAPLGMTSTGVHNWREIIPNRADGYSLFGDKVIGSRRRYQFSIASHYGVQSTVRDLARYDSALSAGTLVPATMLAEMWTPARLSNGQGADYSGIGYGYGWFLERFRGHPIVQHGGSTGTCIYKLPEEKTSVILLTNLEQVAGSDPCFIARGVITQYVPDVMIVGVPPLADRDTALTRRMRSVVDAFANGTPDSTSYSPAYFVAIKALAPQQAPGFRQLGAITSFELVSDDTLSNRVLNYRARYASMAVHFRFVLDARGRIINFTAR